MARFIRLVLFVLIMASAALAQGQLRVSGRYAIEKSSEAVMGAGASLLVMADGNGAVVALGQDLSKPKWSIKHASGISAPPVICPAGVIVGDESGGVSLLDAATGATRYSFKAEGKIVGRPAFVPDAGLPDAGQGARIIVGSYDTHVYCLSAADGKEIWRFKTDAQVHASPLVTGESVIVGGCDGHLRAIALVDGKQKWSTDLGGAIATSPVHHDGRIYAATLSSEAFAVGSDGQIIWKAKPLAEAEPITASPVIAGEVAVFVSDSGQLVALKLSDGSKVSSLKLSGKPSANLLATGQSVICGTDDGKVLLIDAAAGRITQRATVGGAVNALAYAGDKVAACTSEGVLWMLDVTR